MAFLVPFHWYEADALIKLCENGEKYVRAVMGEEVDEGEIKHAKEAIRKIKEMREVPSELPPHERNIGGIVLD